MKLIATMVAILVACTAPSFAGESSLKNKKTPYYRPHYNARKATGATPRQSGDTVIVNAASYEEGISPGGLATIFGDNLTTVSDVLYAYANPLPDELAGVQVFINGIPAPIYGI